MNLVYLFRVRDRRVRDGREGEGEGLANIGIAHRDVAQPIAIAGGNRPGRWAQAAQTRVAGRCGHENSKRGRFPRWHMCPPLPQSLRMQQGAGRGPSCALAS